MRARLILLIVFSSSLALAQGTSRGDASLKLPLTPFQASTGESFIADPGMIQSARIDPANAATVTSNAVFFSHSAWTQDIRTDYLSVAIPLRYGSIALSAANTAVDDIPVREIPGPPIGTFNAEAVFFQAIYGIPITESLRAGIGPKYLYEKIYVDEATGFGFDAGVLYIPPVEGLTIGCSLTDLGHLSAFRAQSTDLPAMLRLGGTYSVSGETINYRAAGAVATEFGTGTRHLSIGVEAAYSNSVSVRLGYESGYDTRGFSAGLGVRYSIFSLDYAFVPFSLNFPDAHIIALSLIF